MAVQQLGHDLFFCTNVMSSQFESLTSLNYKDLYIVCMSNLQIDFLSSRMFG